MASNKIQWELEEDELIIYGEGAMPDYKKNELTPWEEHKASIRTICIERGVTSVGARAFRGCEALETVFLADTVDRIGFAAFRDCKSLQEVDALREFAHRYEKSQGNENNRILMSMQAFRGTPWLQENFGEFYLKKGVLVEYLGENKEVVIPDGIKEIGMMAFENRAVETVTFPVSLKTIRSYAFLNTNLKKVILPESVTLVEDDAFGLTGKLSYVEIQGANTTVAEHAFRGSAVEEELLSAGNEIPSLYKLAQIQEKGILVAKRLNVQKDAMRKIGYTYFDEAEALKKKIKAGAKVLRVCYDEETQNVNYVQAFYKVKRKKELYETYLMYPVGKGFSVEVWRDSLTYLDEKDINSMNTDGVNVVSAHADSKYDWYQVSEDKHNISVYALDLVKQWLKQHPKYKAQSVDDNKEQDPLRMFVPN